MLASVLFAGGAAASFGQVPANGQPVVGGSSLPAAQPTTAPVANAAGASASSTVGPAAAARPAKLEVSYSDGMLTIDAANASLNQVLRQISQKTGMKVTGSVSEESVFGQYGPLPVSEVLASLLDGTGSNMLLVDNKNGPAELVLTPRHGGVSPPSPNSAYAGNNSRNDQQEQQYVPPVRPFMPPTNTGRGPVGVNPDGSPTAFGPGGISPGNEQPRTPQQIYEQLQSQGAQQQASPQDQ